MKTANRHALIVTMAVVLGCLVWTTQASAQTILHLHAKSQPQIWRSPNRLNPDHSLVFSIFIEGREVDHYGTAVNKCRWIMATPHLSLELRNCGRSRLTIRYWGTTPFVFAYHAERHATFY